MADLLETLAEHPAAEILRRANFAEFLARHPRALLFFTGDMSQRTEGRDVAIVVRELLRLHAGRLAFGIVDRRDETVLMAKTGVVALPALAFVADGRTHEVVARMRDWAAYADALARLMSDPPTPPPSSQGAHA